MSWLKLICKGLKIWILAYLVMKINLEHRSLPQSACCQLGIGFTELPTLGPSLLQNEPG